MAQKQQDMSERMQAYSDGILLEVDTAYEIARKARAKGYDPEDVPNIPLAKNLSERVEGLVSAAAPQLKGKGLPSRIQELEERHGKLDWRVALQVSLEVAKQKFCEFEDEKTAMEVGIRVGIAYLTLGVVASPLEGFVELKIRKRKTDGKDYFALMYSGPIRSAGGTAGAVSVLVADYIRNQMGYAPYDPTDEEVRRTVTELYDYHDRVTNLQYLPSEKEIMFLASKLPVQVDGDPSEKIEVSNYKDLDRIETNQIRSGHCLVMGECLAQKAPKVGKQLAKWGKDFSLENWDFIKEFIQIQNSVKSKQKTDDKKPTSKIAPNYTYIKDLVAGRPVLAHPLAPGGFRLRYGRARTGGYSSGAIHPATMHALNGYIGVGTQLKVERPGKATSITSCTSIEGPIVKLNGGDVVFLETEQQAREAKDHISEVLFLGDILFNYGDFLNRAHPLVPVGYCEEWWATETSKALSSATPDKKPALDEGRLERYLREPLRSKPSFKEALDISKSLGVPLHPRYTYHWKLLTGEELASLSSWARSAKPQSLSEGERKLVLPLSEDRKRLLEKIGAPHRVASNEYVVLEKDWCEAFVTQLGVDDVSGTALGVKEGETGLDLVNRLSSVKIRDKSGTFVGARMGRPEKAKVRRMTGNPHTLFPVGEEGGRLRSFQAAFQAGKITAEFPIFLCEQCKRHSPLGVCEVCDTRNKRLYHSETEGYVEEPPKDFRQGRTYEKRSIPIPEMFSHFMKKLGNQDLPDLIKGVKGTSNKDHIPEHPLKGVIRAKHEVYVNKDGTTRYDGTQLPLTQFKPSEVGTSVEKLRSLGYTHDVDGKPLESDGQLLELKPQDLVLPGCKDAPDDGADVVLLNVARFVDEMLEKMYGLEPYYNLSSSEDLAGHLIMMLAPHTSAGIVGRIVGFSHTQGLFAHPMLHAATRRDCDGDEASVSLLLDGLLNFSRQFLPNTRGATQDAPLVLTSRVVPSEVDDMLFDLDVVRTYPLELYEAASEYKNPWDVKIEVVNERLNMPAQYEGYWFTHDTDTINAGVLCSSYKILPSMQEKLQGQMILADRIRAVDAADVAKLVIEKHLIRDIKGNLRKFSTQEFRCVKCNQKYRRPPLAGKCLTSGCSGRLLFTISEGSIVKYLEPAMSLAESYSLPSYICQTLELTKNRVEENFGKEKEKQEGLARWFG